MTFSLLISPAKSLAEGGQKFPNTGRPLLFEKETQDLISVLKTKKVEDFKELMSLSDKLAQLNYQRYQDFGTQVKKEAMFLFSGDVYQGLEAETLSEAVLMRAQARLRILSGLYGLLRPLDLIEPYRLEMGLKFQNGSYPNLYHFWGKKLSYALNKEEGDFVLNLASQEYIKALNLSALEKELVNVSFKEWRNGKLKIISFSAKKARGIMARWILQEEVQNLETLKSFSLEEYRYEETLSSDKDLVFVR